MQAAAARLGAPLGHDFCAISLSDNLKPWAIVERRLRAACEGDFVIALYNPASRARPTRITQAFDLLRRLKAQATPVAFARAVGRADEALILTTLGEADPGLADMATLIVVGSSETRFIARDGGRKWMVTPARLRGPAMSRRAPPPPAFAPVPLPRFAGEDMQRRRLEILPCREAAGRSDRSDGLCEAGEGDRPKARWRGPCDLTGRRGARGSTPSPRRARKQSALPARAAGAP